MKKILFVTSEAHPMIKTGGLADVSGSLPKAIAQLGQDVRLLLPEYQAIHITEPVRHRCRIRVFNYEVEIRETTLPDSTVTVWLVNCPQLFHQPGNPYVDERGQPWANIAERFTLLARVAAEVAMNRAFLDWHPDIVHCNDWQTGLVPALLSLEASRPATLFTIHNMAYQGVFPRAMFDSLGLPTMLWGLYGVEFYGNLSFLKSGLGYADWINTVSATYAEEIQTSAFGCGLEGLLSHRRDFLTGILNGIDSEYWNPETDSYLAANYSANDLSGKAVNKAQLQKTLGLPVAPETPVLGLISRLVEQKGIDLFLECLSELVLMPLQIVVLGSGNKSFEQRLQQLAALYPGRIAVMVGYDEAQAHLIEAGADIFLMPSRFEPCGLNQMYSLRYGTVPVVRKTGGLADTVTDALPQSLQDGSANGFVFEEISPGALLETIKRALLVYANPPLWRQLQITGMQGDFSWDVSAQRYLELYQKFC
ncbi:MAG: glycogen synthase GlgA [Methylococcales bacterium]|nr:glycogen synthase GlgA [Methylococcales bacterium]